MYVIARHEAIQFFSSLRGTKQSSSSRHCEVRSNPEILIQKRQILDCFVPRNDGKFSTLAKADLRFNFQLKCDAVKDFLNGANAFDSDAFTFLLVVFGKRSGLCMIYFQT